LNDLSSRSAIEVLQDHLGLAQQWADDAQFHRSLEDDIRRNVSEDIVVIMARGIFKGHDGVRYLAQTLGQELPERRSFEYTFVAAEGRMGFLEWTYEDNRVRVKDGVDSYLIEDGKIVVQTIHYTVEQLASA
jgi:hypothetical protein